MRFVLLLSLFAVGCATEPHRGSRKGLLETGNRSTASHRKLSREDFVAGGADGMKLKGRWGWPLTDVDISSRYGDRGRKFHQGIDLRARIGTPVHAAADGEVVYVGAKIKGYGRMVVLKHNGGFYTVYAHHSKNLVKMGEHVDLGQVIAKSGKSGRAHGAHLHFELRRGTQSYDPEYAFNAYLKNSPNRRVASRNRLTEESDE